VFAKLPRRQFNEALRTRYVGDVYLFLQISSAMLCVIPACRHKELNVPCGILLLFLGTITTRLLP